MSHRTHPGTVDGVAMRAVEHVAYSAEPEQALRVTQVPRPVPGDDEVLVRVRAASLDRGTWHLMLGEPYLVRLVIGLRRPRPLNPGRSVAGTVEQVGAAVTAFRPGDEVYGVAPNALAEYAVAKPGKLALTPAALTAPEAAALPISGLTALQAVRDHARVRPGESVLVLGASGGVGSVAVQVAAASGAEVTGVCGPTNLDLVAGLGARHVLDYTAVDPTDGNRRYDVILDIAGNRPLSALRHALAERGRLVIVGGDGGGPWLGGLDRQLRAQLLSPWVRQKLGTFVASENAADLEALRELVETGAVRPAVDGVHPLEEVATAMRRLADGHPRGKVVVLT